MIIAIATRLTFAKGSNLEKYLVMADANADEGTKELSEADVTSTALDTTVTPQEIVKVSYNFHNEPHPFFADSRIGNR